mmetsp:Transcript_12571/g.26431  ORF Transcript_12571/g.26431 Transcript_12571/m.26431 type:complete len:181 (-) Transcript_12571:1294-1836(-)
MFHIGSFTDWFTAVVTVVTVVTVLLLEVTVEVTEVTEVNSLEVDVRLELRLVLLTVKLLVLDDVGTVLVDPVLVMLREVEVVRLVAEASDVLVTVLSLDVMLKVVVRLLVEVKVLRVELTVTVVVESGFTSGSSSDKTFSCTTRDVPSTDACNFCVMLCSFSIVNFWTTALDANCSTTML